MKVLINRCHGGFTLSPELIATLPDNLANNIEFLLFESDKLRTNLILIEAVEKLGLIASSGEYSKIEIIEIPNDIKWYIDEYDGMECIREVHGVWS